MTAPTGGLSDVGAARGEGGSPWALAALLEAGDPGQITAMAAGWGQAADTAEQATTAGQNGSTATGQGALGDGAPMHPDAEAAAQTSRQLGLGGAEMRTVSTTLTAVGDSLSDNTQKAQTTIAALESQLGTLQRDANAAIQANADSANAQLATAQSSQQADAIHSNARFVESGIIDKANADIAAAIQQAAIEIQGFIDAYETVLGDGQRALSAIGIVPDDAAELGLDNLGADVPPPPAGGTPQQNTDWWNGLTPEQRTSAIATQPALIGNMDGVPGAARDLANRSLLDDHRRALEQELLTTDDPQTVRNKLASLDQVEQVLDRTDRDGVPRQLLSLDFSGERATAAVSVGDVDTADHVAVYTQGLDSKIGEAGNDGQNWLARGDGEAVGLRNVAMAEGDGGDVAVVNWIGYEAPQSSPDSWLDPSQSVLNDDAAQVGGERLRNFANGIDSSRGDANDPHITAIGWSYGSTTTGFALREPSAIDDAVIFGSPGLGTPFPGRDLHVAEDGAIYNVEADNDFTPDSGYYGGDPAGKNGIVQLSSESSTAPDGTPLREVAGHFHYLEPGTTSHRNIGLVVGGRGDEAVQSDWPEYLSDGAYDGTADSDAAGN